jgi:hypothetical protein
MRSTVLETSPQSRKYRVATVSIWVFIAIGAYLFGIESARADNLPASVDAARMGNADRDGAT